MKILITGATGNLGNKVGFELKKMGHDIVVLSRSEKSAKEKLTFPAEIICKNLATQALAADDFKGIEAVIHLMGETVDGRWSAAKKNDIISSRIESSKNLLMNMPTTVQTVISASAQGFYGDRKNQVMTEANEKGTGFLADVCDQWENPFRQIQQRTVQLRIGIILDPQSGALKKMIPLFQKNLGASLGTGQQYMSWISIEDMTAVVLHSLFNKSLSGPVNCSTINPVQNSEFTKFLIQNLGTIQLPNVPEFMLKILFGEMHSILTGSIQMSPNKLIESGFKFKYTELQNYFESVLVDYINGQSVMYSLQFLPFDQKKVFDFFSEARNLESITPQNLNFKIINVSTPEITEGTLIDYKLKIHGVPVSWKTLISEWDVPNKFIDQQLKGPYSVWHHTHEFHSFFGGTLMIDRVKFKLPMGTLGNMVAGTFVQSDVENIFKYRRSVIAEKSF